MMFRFFVMIGIVLWLVMGTIRPLFPQQTIRCADPKCPLCLSFPGMQPLEKFDTQQPRHRPEDVPFGREGTLAVVNPVIRYPYQSFLSLRGNWEFCTDPEAVGIDNEWMQPGAAWPDSRLMSVPGNWESQGLGEPGMSTPWVCYWDNLAKPLKHIYIGSAWYRTTFDVPEDWAGKRIWLKIGGVRAQGWFWVNGEPTAKMADYCGSYRFEITDLVQPGQKAVLTALIRNDVPSRTGLVSACHQWGGIYRDIEIEATPEIHIANVECVGDFERQAVDVQITLNHPLRSAGTKVALQIALWDHVQHVRNGFFGSGMRSDHLALETVDLMLSDSGTTQWTQSITIPDFKPWSPESPQLYAAVIGLITGPKSPIVHGWIERFGVKKFEVVGDRLYLNGKPYFLRGYGDDYVYPKTMISPPDREAHRHNLQIVRNAGFVYVRHHTHCEIPEYYEAADELGIMIQPELPYYPYLGFHTTEYFDFDPKRDLNELIDHYRRYVSLSTYCMGNEGHLGTPLDNELKQLVKQRDPGRLVMHQDGGVNTPENSDFVTPNVLSPISSIVPWEPGAFDHLEMPFIAHEYMNLGLKFDPRVSQGFTGAILPPRPLDRYEKQLEKIGLDRSWGFACQDAGHVLQRHYQKEGIESARLDPACDGYSFWTIIDVIVKYAEGDSFTGQGMFDPFYNPKSCGAAPADVARFNAPTVILMKPEKMERILVSGEKIKIPLWISHFGQDDLVARKLLWHLRTQNNDVLAQGEIDGIALKTGDVKQVGIADFVVPQLEKAESLFFETRLEKKEIANDWAFWGFPIREKVRLEGVAVSPDLLKRLETRYDGLLMIGTPEAETAQVVVVTSSHPVSPELLASDKNIMILDEAQGPPNVKLGWWSIGNQTGTAFADHPVFGDFPHDGHINPLWFRLIKRGMPISVEMPFDDIEYLSVGEGRNDYFLYLGQAKTGKNGKILLVYGLDLLADTPEGEYLLDRFLSYMGNL